MAEEIMMPGAQLVLFLNRIVEEQEYENGDTNVNLKSVSSVEDYPQFKFKVNIIHEGKDDLNLFAKLIELSHRMWDSVVIKPYEKERLFYTSLMQAYKRLEDKHGISEQDKLKLPAFYGAESAHRREILVLEDLTSRGFCFTNRFEQMSWPYAAAAVTELAKFHALSLVFRHESPDEYEKIATQLPQGIFEKNNDTVRLLESFKSLAFQTVRNENKKRLKAFFKNQDFLKSYNELLKPLNCKTIVHGHFWPKNTLHKVLDDGTVEVVIVDFQTIQVGSPVTDLIHFIFTSTDAAFRANHYNELIQLYRSELIQAASRLGLDIEQEYSSIVLESEIAQKLPFGLFAATAFLPVLALDDREDRARGMPGNDESHGYAAVHLYAQRVNQVVDFYVDAEILKENQQSKSDKRCGMCFLC